MRKSLKDKLTGSMMLTVAVAMVIVSVCLLFGTMRYSAVKFADDVTGIFTSELLTELNMASVGTAESAAVSVEQVMEANAGSLGIGAGREYSIWDVESGNCVGGTLTEVSMTDNIVAAMRGEVGDADKLFSAKLDIAIPINGEVLLVLDIVDDGSAMRALCWNVFLLLAAAFVLSIIVCLLLSRLLSDAFAQSAVETAQEMRACGAQDGDWEALALAMNKLQNTKASETDAMDSIVPYISDGYVKFTTEGAILEMSTNAEHMLGVTFNPDAAKEDMLTFEKAFRGVPMPQETQSMVHGRFTQAGLRLEVYFVALQPGIYAAVIHPVGGYGI